jgi:hypothetical protein
LLELTFLPLGADANTVVYRVVADDKTSYFLKLRTGDFDELSLEIPQFLKSQGMQPLFLRSRPGPGNFGAAWGNTS